MDEPKGCEATPGDWQRCSLKLIRQGPLKPFPGPTVRIDTASGYTGGIRKKPAVLLANLVLAAGLSDMRGIKARPGDRSGIHPAVSVRCRLQGTII